MSINYHDDVQGILRGKVAIISANIQILKKIYPLLETNAIDKALDEIVIVGDKLKDMPIEEYKDLGCHNEWDSKDLPDKYIKCIAAEHETQDRDLNADRTYTEHKCEICKIVYRTDHSD